MVLYNRITFISVYISVLINVVFSNKDREWSRKFSNYLDVKYSTFKDEQSILSFFKKEKVKYPDRVDYVLKAYNDCYQSGEIPQFKTRRRPFIVIEGSNFLSKDRVANILAKEMRAQYMLFPPYCMFHLRAMFDNGSMLKHAFFYLALYAAAYNVRQMLSRGKAVIMNGYWSQQAEFIIRSIYKSASMLPSAGSDIYKHPKDLLMPDILIYIKSPLSKNNILEPNQNHGMEQKTAEIYNKFNNPPADVIDYSKDIKQVIDDIFQKMQIMVNKNTDLDMTREGIFPNKTEPNFMLFKNEKAVITYFENEWIKNKTLINQLLETYNDCFCEDEYDIPKGKRAPFIVIEGNDYTNRKEVTQLLAWKLKAKAVGFIPHCLFPVRAIFEKGSVNRQAFFALTLYATAHNVKKILSQREAVVLNGYWYEQAAFIIGKKHPIIEDLPTKGDRIYNPPKDLIMPDMLIFLNFSVPNEDYGTRFSKYLPRSLKIYNNFNCSRYELIESSADAEDIVDKVAQKIKNLLGRNFKLNYIQ